MNGAAAGLALWVEFSLAAEKLRRCEAGELSHAELRAELRAHGVRNSFLGSTQACLHELCLGVLRGDRTTVPAQLQCGDTMRAARRCEYERLLSQLTLDKLAQHLPQAAWVHYNSHGWLKLQLNLSSREKHMIELCHRLLLCELGVTPTDPATYVHAEHVLGYDRTYGWLRTPACSLAQLYLATHPQFYRWQVGLYARLLLRERARGRIGEMGAAAIHDPVRCCVELRLQLYNTKLHLPSSRPTCLAHLDCEWKRGGLATPAPQANVVCSDSHVDGTEVFRCRFIDARDAIEAHLQKDADEPSAKRQRVRQPYRFPRPPKDAAPRGRASDPPLECRDFGDASRLATGPTSLTTGEVLFFDHLTAHLFHQSALNRPLPETVPFGWTRRAEYPTIVAPHLHGEPHQSINEVMATLLTGRPPTRWAHVYVHPPCVHPHVYILTSTKARAALLAHWCPRPHTALGTLGTCRAARHLSSTAHYRRCQHSP